MEGAVEALRPAPAPRTNATAAHIIHAKTVTANATAANTTHGKTVTFAKTVSVNATAAHKIHAQTVTVNATTAHAVHGKEQKTQADDDAEEEEPELPKKDAKAGNQTKDEAEAEEPDSDGPGAGGAPRLRPVLRPTAPGFRTATLQAGGG